MLIKFFVRTGAAVDDRPGDPDARRAIAYFLGEVVLKPERYGGPKVKTRRATAPILLSGQDWLVSQTCADLPFKHRYASGAIVFHAGDIDIAAWTAGTPALRGVTEALMRDFEDTAFAGIPEDRRPEVLWVAHTDKGRLELNFLFVRAVPDRKGKLTAINPKPPGTFGTDLWDAFRDSWNCRHGWADPMDPERHRDLKLPGALISTPTRDFEGNATFDIREELAIEIGHQIENGTIKCRDDVLRWLRDQGHKIGRVGEDYISLRYLLPRPLYGPRKAPAEYHKTIRLRGDLFDKRFTSLEWLDTCGWNDGGLAPQRRDMRGAAAALQRLRAARAAHHRRRHGWPEEMPTPQPEAGDEIEGLTCAWVPPRPGERPRPKPRQPSFDEARLPDDLIAKLRFVDYRTRRIWLQDGSSVEDLEHRLRMGAQHRSLDALRLMIAQARLKQWSGISAKGDAGFLRAAARLAFAEGIEIAGRDAEMDRIVQDELDGLRAAQAEAGVMHDASGMPEVSSGAEAEEQCDAVSGTETTGDIPWFEQEMDMEALFAWVRAMRSGGPQPKPKPDADADADADADGDLPGCDDDVEPGDQLDRVESKGGVSEP